MNTKNIYRNYKHIGIIRNLSPMTHNKGNEGNYSLINTLPVYYQNKTVEVPIISGNSLRNRIIRQPGMLYMIRELGLEGQLTRTQLNLLMAGGALTKSTANYDMGLHREMRQMIPLLSVLGGALPGQIEHGNLTMMIAYLICRESIGLIQGIAPNIPEFNEIENLCSYATFKMQTQYTRVEPTRSPVNQNLLAQKDKTELIEAQQKTKKEGENTQQMIYGGSAIQPGAGWFFGFQLRNVTEIEYGAVLTSIALFKDHPYLGGQSRIGHGHVELKLLYEKEMQLESTQELPIQGGLGEMYRKHLQNNSQEIVNILRKVTE